LFDLIRTRRFVLENGTQDNLTPLQIKQNKKLVKMEKSTSHDGKEEEEEDDDEIMAVGTVPPPPPQLQSQSHSEGRNDNDPGEEGFELRPGMNGTYHVPTNLNPRQERLARQIRLWSDVDLAIDFMQQPRAPRYRALMSRAVDSLEYWLNGPSFVNALKTFQAVKHPDCPIEFIYYVHFVLLARFAPYQQVFFDNSEPRRMMRFYTMLLMQLQNFVMSPVQPCNVVGLFRMMKDIVTAVLMDDMDVAAAEVFAYGPNIFMEEQRLSCVNRGMKVDGLSLPQNEIARYSVHKPCLPLLDPRRDVAQIQAPMPVAYGLQRPISFLDQMVNAPAAIRKMNAEQMDVMRWRLMDGAHFKGNRRLDELRQLNESLGVKSRRRASTKAKTVEDQFVAWKASRFIRGGQDSDDEDESDDEDDTGGRPRPPPSRHRHHDPIDMDDGHDDDDGRNDEL
jgi:hypothetical protein